MNAFFRRYRFPRVGRVSGAGLLAVLLALSGAGCSSLLPTSRSITLSHFASYDDAIAAFERIAPGKTSEAELNGLGFGQGSNPNVRVLTYLDVLQRFVPNNSVTLNDLDPAVQRFLAAREQGRAWEIDLNNIKSSRYGNAFLDVFGFARRTHETGWQFRALLLVQDGRVVYKLASGQPVVDRYEQRVRPLGPFQDLERVFGAAVESRF